MQRITPKLITVTLVLQLAYWLIGKAVNVYNTILLGIVYELLWLPMIVIAIGLPILICYRWYKQGYSFRNVYFFLLLAWAVEFLLVVLL